MKSACSWSWLMIASALLAGCAEEPSSVDPLAVAAHREQLLLAQEPQGAIGVIDARLILAASTEIDQQKNADDPEAPAPNPVSAADASDHEQTVVVVGKLGGVPNPWKQAQPDYPFTTGQAQFFIADADAAAEAENHAHTHGGSDHDDCPYCAAVVNSSVLAVVRFQDDAGRTIAIDSRELFDLQGTETVIVRGKLQMLGGEKDGIMLVDADGLYVRP